MSVIKLSHYNSLMVDPDQVIRQRIYHVNWGHRAGFLDLNNKDRLTNLNKQLSAGIGSNKQQTETC